jgi:H+/Cl- antiporter ClcA
MLCTGMIFSCSCGLPLGKEGPMVHVGAVVAAGVSQVSVLGKLLDQSTSISR